MDGRLLLILPLLFLPGNAGSAGGKGPWNGKPCAVVLTYDDGLGVHLRNVVPLLDSLGFRGTFYVPGSAASLRDSTALWAAAASRGHELGNHSLFHPCDSRPPGREWVSPDYDLRTYSVRRILDELRTANVLLQAIDGRNERTFAYTCGESTAGDSSFVGGVRELFPGARGTKGVLQRPDEVDLYEIGSFMVAEQPGERLITLVREAIDRQALLVFLFHGVGGEHAINVSLNAHRQLLTFLKERQPEIWVAPMIDVVDFLRSVRARPWHPGAQNAARTP